MLFMHPEMQFGRMTFPVFCQHATFHTAWTRSGPSSEFLRCSSDDVSRCCGNTAWGGSKMTSGFIDIEGDSLARGRADRVERKTLRYQRVYA
jgi:hypothetical protein